MRFRPANISLINRRHYLPRLLLTLSSKGQIQKPPQPFEDVDRVTPYQLPYCRSPVQNAGAPAVCRNRGKFRSKSGDHFPQFHLVVPEIVIDDLSVRVDQHHERDGFVLQPGAFAEQYARACERLSGQIGGGLPAQAARIGLTDFYEPTDAKDELCAPECW